METRILRHKSRNSLEILSGRRRAFCVYPSFVNNLVELLNPLLGKLDLPLVTPIQKYQSNRLAVKKNRRRTEPESRALERALSPLAFLV